MLMIYAYVTSRNMASTFYSCLHLYIDYLAQVGSMYVPVYESICVCIRKRS